jgi:phage anti-repressor protein
MKHVEITKEGITRWFHKLIKNLYIKNSIYFAIIVHRQEYRNEI